MQYARTMEKAKTIIHEQINDEKVKEVFFNCFEDTLRNTVKISDDETAFMQTGDIPAMWLRDSSLQLRPYLPFLEEDGELKELVRKVIKRQMKYILIDPYANAFNEEANGNRWDDDVPLQKPMVWERKYEIDSLCFPIQLAYQYWKYTQDASIFDNTFKEVLLTIISIWKVEQNHALSSTYTFQRPGRKNMLVNDGQGSAVGYTGMTWSGFRPSDDACKYHYLVPSNYLAAHILTLIAEIALQVYDADLLKMSALHLREEIKTGIRNHAICTLDVDRILAYEVNGLGDVLLIDDSNMPSLLSLPLITEMSIDDELYHNTRKFILSRKNPYYIEGKYMSGVGSPHTRNHFVWPLGITVEGLTSTSNKVKWDKITMIAYNDANTNFVHESVDPNNPENYTREWFSWANSMYCELVLDYCGLTVRYK